ncbi:MAG: hypothetical protein EOP04_01955 [Proteobacteria bacterium]|nr:MAG: hypothetical protein EOP04_01955 [Pseudomonadota bacterium]
MPLIYKITCLSNGKVYVGSTMKTFQDRYPHGRYWAYTSNAGFQDDCFFFGLSQMSVEILETIEEIPAIDLKAKERVYIDKLNSLVPHGYNYILPYSEKLSSYEHEKLSTKRRKINQGLPWFKGEPPERIRDRVKWDAIPKSRHENIHRRIEAHAGRGKTIYQ